MLNLLTVYQEETQQVYISTYAEIRRSYALLGFFPMNYPWNSKFSMKKPMKDIHGSLRFHEKCMKYFML